MQTTLSHFRVLEQIGQGGMGVVYRAHDEHLDCDVALKVLSAHQSLDEAGRKRFRKEALALSKLHHPNIAIVHDFDTQDGTDFLVEELILGRSLDEILAGAPLPESEILALGAQLADGLAAAHAQGVVHCDLKPANIRVTPDGQLKILDFGLAKLTHRSVSDQGVSLTASLSGTDTLAGTLPYMAPEQLLERKVDASFDIWAFGCVLYEMATGRRAFPDLGPALVESILHQPVTLPTRLNGKISPALEAVILKCLEKEPRLRYASAKEILVDLNRLVNATAAPITRPRADLFTARRTGIAILLVGMITAGSAWLVHTRRTVATSAIRAIAVLPLANLSRDPQQEFFADGMTDELITELSKIKALKVTSRTSVLRYKDTQRPLPEIAHELNVDAVVEGSVLRAGDRVRITAQLIHASTDQHLWAEEYDRDLRDVLSLHRDVARAIAQQIKITLTPGEQAQLAAAPRVVPEAHEAYLRGRYHATRFSREPLLKARDYLLQAIEKDPAYAPAYAELSHVYIKLRGAAGGAQDHDFLNQARSAADKAMEIDPSLAQAHTVAGLVSVFSGSDLRRGFAELGRAVELDPNSADALIHDSFSKLLQGRRQLAVAEAARALEIEPLNVEVSVLAGQLFFATRDYDRAISQMHKTLEIEPNFPRAYFGLSSAYAFQGRYPEAVRAQAKGMELTGAGDKEIAGLRDAVAKQDGRGFWNWQLQKQIEIAKRGFDAPVDQAGSYAMLGDKVNALACLERAWRNHDPDIISIHSSPRFDSLRSEPRFQDLLRRTGLAP